MSKLKLGNLINTIPIDVNTYVKKHDVKWKDENVVNVPYKNIENHTKVKDEVFLTHVSAFAGRKPFSSDTDLAFVETFIQEAYVAVTSRWEHLSDAPLSFFQETDKLNLIFARLVALCLRTSAVLYGKKYELDKMYMRINLEKKKVMNYFRNVTYEPDKRSNMLDIASQSIDDLNPNTRTQ